MFACGREDNNVLSLVGYRTRKKPFSRVRRKWEDNIKIKLREIGWEVVG
jgi:hypothetical protein